MAKFKKARSKVPTNIGTVTLTIQDHATKGLTTFYKIDINTDGGALASREQGELNEFLNEGQITKLETLLAEIRSKAVEFMEEDPIEEPPPEE